MSSLKDFVEYIDNIFYQEHKDINAIKNCINIFFEFYKKKEFNPETLFLLKLISEKVNEDSDQFGNEEEILLMLSSCFLGMCLEKYSKKIRIENYDL